MDKIEILGNFHRFYFIFADVDLPARPKKRYVDPTAVLHPFPAVTNLLLVGMWF